MNAPILRRFGGRPVARTGDATVPALPTVPGTQADLLLEGARRHRSRLVWRLVAFVAVPTLASVVWFALFASPRYVAHAELTYSVYRPPASLSAGLAESFAGTSENNAIDLGSIVHQYVRSDAIVREVERRLPLRSVFSEPGLDPLARLPAHASRSELLGAYRSRVAMSEGLGGYLTLDVATADPRFSLALAQAIVAACDAMVDAISARARDDEMRFAEAEVAREEDRVRHARAALTRFQDAHGTEDPERAAGALNSVVAALESDLAAARAQLAASVPFLSAGAPAVRQLHARIASLTGQLAAENARLAGSSGAPMSQLLDEYSRLQLEQEFARTAYTQAEQGLAAARADAARRQNYLVTFVEPSLPDRPDLGQAVEVTASVFLASLLLLTVLSILGGALRDQSGL